jgi:hypothetical protein
MVTILMVFILCIICSLLIILITEGGLERPINDNLKTKVINPETNKEVKNIIKGILKTSEITDFEFNEYKKEFVTIKNIKWVVEFNDPRGVKRIELWNFYGKEYNEQGKLIKKYLDNEEFEVEFYIKEGYYGYVEIRAMLTRIIKKLK